MGFEVEILRESREAREGVERESIKRTKTVTRRHVYDWFLVDGLAWSDFVFCCGWRVEGEEFFALSVDVCRYLRGIAGWKLI